MQLCNNVWKPKGIIYNIYFFVFYASLQILMKIPKQVQESQHEAYSISYQITGSVLHLKRIIHLSIPALFSQRQAAF